MRSKVRNSHAKVLCKKFVGTSPTTGERDRHSSEPARRASTFQFLIEWQTTEGDLMIKSFPEHQKAPSEVLSEGRKAPHLISTWQHTWNLLESVSTALGPQEYVSVSHLKPGLSLSTTTQKDSDLTKSLKKNKSMKLQTLKSFWKCRPSWTQDLRRTPSKNNISESFCNHYYS